MVVGGSAVDIISKSNQKVLMNNSNIGSISMKFGGTSWNVVEGLVKQGYKN